MSYLSTPIISLLLMLFLAPDSIAGPQEIIKVYTYHDKPPYIIYDTDITDIQAGIYHELVDTLNKNNDVQKYELIYMPRVRLELLLQKGKLQGVIIGVNPLWFGDKDKQRYLWSKPFMEDKDIFLMNAENQLNFKGITSLTGLTIAIERGTYYKGVTELINESKLELSPTNSSRQNLDMLAHQRADVTIMSQLTANYFFNQDYQRSSFKIIPQPHDIFQRSILIPKSMARVIAPINKTISKLNKKNDWLIQFDNWISAI